MIAIGSIVSLVIPGGRSTDGEPCQIPAMVIGQYDDGTLKLFCFHFEGQFMQLAPESAVSVLFDAAVASETRIQALDDLREIVQNDIATLQRQMNEFQEQVLSLVVGQTAAKEAEMTPIIAPEIPADPSATGVESTSARRRR